MALETRYLATEVVEPVAQHVAQQTREVFLQRLARILPGDADTCVAVLLRVDPLLSSILAGFSRELHERLLPQVEALLRPGNISANLLQQQAQQQGQGGLLTDWSMLGSGAGSGLGPLDARFAFAFGPGVSGFGAQHTGARGANAGGFALSPAGKHEGLSLSGLQLQDQAQQSSATLQSQMQLKTGGAGASTDGLLFHGTGQQLSPGQQLSDYQSNAGFSGLSPGAGSKYERTPMFHGAPGPAPSAGGSNAFKHQFGGWPASSAALAASSVQLPMSMPFTSLPEAAAALDATTMQLLNSPDLAGLGQGFPASLQGQSQHMLGNNPGDVAASLMGFHGYDGSAVVTASQQATALAQQQGALNGAGHGLRALSYDGSEHVSATPSSGYASPPQGLSAHGEVPDAAAQSAAAARAAAPAGPEQQQQAGIPIPSQPPASHGISPLSPSPVTSSPASSVTSSSGLVHPHHLQQLQTAAKGLNTGPVMSMAAKLQQAAARTGPPPLSTSPTTASAMNAAAALKAKAAQAAAIGANAVAQAQAAAAFRPPPDMPPRFRVLPPAVQCKIHTLTKDNHVVLIKDFDEKVLSKICLLCDKFGAVECLGMLDRIEEVLKGKAGRLANGPGYLDVSVSTRLDELKQRAAGQVTAPEDYARSTLHSRIYGELRSLVEQHSFLRWEHFDQGIVNMLKKMPNNVAVERLSELRYHSMKNVDSAKSCIVSILTSKPKYTAAGM